MVLALSAEAGGGYAGGLIALTAFSLLTLTLARHRPADAPIGAVARTRLAAVAR